MAPSKTIAEPEDYNVGTYIAYRIEELGVRDFFVVPGDTNLTLLDNLLKNPRLRMVGCCNELNTGYAADGYARASKTRTAVVVIPYIVGGLSILNAISGARSEQLKIIVISGCPPTKVLTDDKATHHTPSPTNKGQALHVFQGVTAASVRINSAETAAEVVDETILKCVRKSLPVYIEVPHDIAGVPCRRPAPLSQNLEVVRQPNRNSEALDAIVGAWNLATSPVLLIGSYVQVSLSRDSIQRLVDALGCPVLCQPDGRWISESHPQYEGLFWPGVLNLDGEKVVMNSDLWLGIGVSWSDVHNPALDLNNEKHRLVSMQYGRVDLPDDRIIQPVELDELVLALIDSGISRKAGSFPRPNSNRPARIHAQIKDSNDALTMTTLFTGIQDILREHFTLIADTGDTWFAASHIKLPDGVDFYIQLSYASIGWGVPATLGAQVARSKGRVVLMVGDGGFQMTAQEISTMIRMKLNPIIFLFNNLGYKTETTVHEGPYNYIANWDYTKLATSFLHEPHARPHNLFAGDDVDKESDMPVWAEKIRTQADLLRALQRIERENDKLAFLECCVRPDDITPELQELGKKVSKGLA